MALSFRFCVRNILTSVAYMIEDSGFSARCAGDMEPRGCRDDKYTVVTWMFITLSTYGL